MTFVGASATLSLVLSSILLIINVSSFTPEETVVWSCEALGKHRSYKAGSVSRDRPNFELTVYAAPGFASAPLETLQISTQVHLQEELLGTGRLSTGEEIRVQAFRAGGVEFRVEDARGGAIGRCVRDTITN